MKATTPATSFNTVSTSDAFSDTTEVGTFFDELPTMALTMDELLDDCFDLRRIGVQDTHQIVSSMVCIIAGMCCLEEICVSESDLFAFLCDIGGQYRTNPYHNLHHALAVIQYTAILLIRTKTSSLILPKDCFTILIAAAVHDVAHPGTNNAFQLSSNSHLAATFGEKSVLETMHIHTALASLREENLLGQWSGEEQERAHKLLSRMILRTDMACHGEMTAMLVSRSALADPFRLVPGDSVGDEEAEENLFVFCETLLHAADISNAVRPFAQSQTNSLCLAIEFNNQVETEKSEGLKVTEFMVQPSFLHVCRGEIFFLNSVAGPYWRALGARFPSLLTLELNALDANIQSWRDLQASEELGLEAKSLTDRLKQLRDSTEF